MGNKVFPNQVLNEQLNTCDASAVQTRQTSQSRCLILHYVCLMKLITTGPSKIHKKYFLFLRSKNNIYDF